MFSVFCLKQSTAVSRMVSAVSLVIVFLSVSGCGKQLPEGKTKIFGTVTVDGQPLVFLGEGLFAISFVAQEGTEVAGSRLDKSNGKFELVLSPGDYTAVVTATDGFGEEPKPGVSIPPKSLVPTRYNSQDTSDVIVTVPPSGGAVEVPLKSL